MNGQPAGTGLQTGLGFVPWQDAEHRAPGRGDTALPDLDPNTHLPCVRSTVLPSKRSSPQPGGSSLGTGEAAGVTPRSGTMYTCLARSLPLPAAKVRRGTQSSTPTAQVTAKAAVCKEHGQEAWWAENFAHIGRLSLGHTMSLGQRAEVPRAVAPREGTLTCRELAADLSFHLCLVTGSGESLMEGGMVS